MTMRSLIVALLAGAATAFGLPPSNCFHSHRHAGGAVRALAARGDARRGCAARFCLGHGLFSRRRLWVYVSLHDVGGMALPLAAVATLGFCAVAGGISRLGRVLLSAYHDD